MHASQRVIITTIIISLPGLKYLPGLQNLHLTLVFIHVHVHNYVG